MTGGLASWTFALGRARPRGLLVGLLVLGLLGWPAGGGAHPLGNFSISQYTALRIGPDAVELRYLIDMAEIPTFQEIQETGIFPEPGHPSLDGWLPRTVERLKDGLSLEVDGRRLPLTTQAREVIFPPGAGGLPTLKLGAVFRAALPPGGTRRELRFRDGNFPDRAGWKEVIAVARPGAGIEHSSVPGADRSRELADYPTDLLDSPPQDREARVLFTGPAPPPVASARPRPPAAVPAGPPAPAGRPPAERARDEPAPPREAGATPEAVRLQPNRQGTPRSAFTDLLTAKELGPGVVAVALALAAALGAFHALEPGHGKTVVAAYLIGARGTAWHAVLLGLVVTASHTAGVYALGVLTLYGSRYVVPERVYPWLGAVSGLAIAVLGLTLLVRRYAEGVHGHGHDHGHAHVHPHGHGPDAPHAHDHSHEGEPDHHHHAGTPGARVSVGSLVTLGTTGGMVPCPGALVVLLSAVSLNRVGFGLLLIVAFSVGLAAVLIAIGMLMVYARRFMGRFHADGPLVQRWLPLASSAVITVIGLVLAIQALVAGGVLQVRL
jgi:ABC-type nickel/cobalt efflux system permease component RcnA